MHRSGSSGSLPPPVDGHLLEHPLFSGRFVRLFTHADGSCFFHSIAAALNWKGYRDASHVARVRLGRELRSKIVTKERWDDFIRKLDVNKSTFDDGALPSFDQATNYREDAEDMIWNLTARALGICILVVKDMDTIFTSSADEIMPLSLPTVILAWINGNHFEPMVERIAPSSESAHFHPSIPSELEKVFCAIDKSDEADDEDIRRAMQPSDMNYVGLFDGSHPIVRKLLSLKSR